MITFGEIADALKTVTQILEMDADTHETRHGILTIQERTALKRLTRLAQDVLAGAIAAMSGGKD